jgi:quercetin dioxygenase-like cupin family protein
MTRQLAFLAVGIVLGAAGCGLALQAGKVDPAGGTKSRVLLEQVLAEKLGGKEAKVTLVEVTKEPGAGGSPHRHPGPVVGYVLEGEFESQVEGGLLRTYRKGDVFFEPARALHAVSRNPSKAHSTRFLAFFVTAADEKHLVLPEKP